MNFFINQNITIHTLRVEAISNSSVFQIGSAGIIKPLSQLYNTGGFTKPAQAAESSGSSIPFIPLSEPSL
ncbi:spore germination protein GerPB [Paenibacillus rigui]|uniref:Spore gernimation protein KA n=1 Tax=Paenibacillus rigui TaxID=554312 RepID=A0A229UV09_9BACL|nr:spore germination protein GerPB [Paenibacillus rigui]OXM86995.1 spore gernimation protein KA [Paenibacillus rigui]